MIAYPDIDPIAISIGPLDVRWYGLTYLAAFAAAWWLGNRRAAREDSGWTRDDVADLVFYGALGVVLGGRIGYVFFYNFRHFLDDPLYLFAIREGGMSFHGGLIGVTLAVWWFGRKTGRSLLQVTDFTAPIVPIGLGCGRIGNFLNAELPGRIADVPWAFVYPQQAVRDLPSFDVLTWATTGRHPSSLYQAFTEGVVLFALVWLFSSRRRPEGAVAGMFLLGYGTLRFCTEFFREPDAHIGFVALDWLSMGQLLCVPMILAGLGLIAWAYLHEAVEAATGDH
ncbi:MAG: prolipoprotein diacylglyceryl transferase [Pseudomonadales bacterium]|jgi:phosphatidylglycerol:prolipoprotein diacylglycerol transferase|nr:prolipoprotein diacylglyceryl transferase [Pseudomonadales bacterium]